MITQLEIRYVELSKKAIHVPLTDEEFEEVKSTDKELGFEPCPHCEGTGVHVVQGMMGGREQYYCNKCEGTGYANYTTYVQNQLKSEEF